ncbi:uncharacterized protein LOC106880339 isoform X1 [Argonauta hians]
MHSEGKDNLEKASLKDDISIEGMDDSEVEEEPEKTFRQKLAELLQCNKVQYTIIFFVVIDGLIVILELLIDLDIIKLSDKPPGHVESHDVEDHGDYNASYDTSTLHTLLSNEGTPYDNEHHVVYHRGDHNTVVKQHGRHHNSHNEHAIVTQAITTLSHFLLNSTADYDDDDGNHSLIHDDVHGDGHGGGHGGHHAHSEKEIAEHSLHYASLAILCIFLVEVICKIIAEGTHLLKHKAEVLDAIVVVVSFTLDIVFSFVDVAQAAKDAAGLMVMLRLWRITRIINGVIISVQMEAEKKIHKVEKLLHAAEKENDYLRDQITKLKEELESVRKKQKKEDVKKEDVKSIGSVSQKTEDDLMDILMGWDSPQFLNSNSGKTVLTPSTTTTMTLSSPTQTYSKEIKSPASNTQSSSKSMFVVFDDVNKLGNESNPDNARNYECLCPNPPVFVVPTQVTVESGGSPKHSSNSSNVLDTGEHSQQKLDFKPFVHQSILNTAEENNIIPSSSIESTGNKHSPRSPVQYIPKSDSTRSKMPSETPSKQILEDSVLKTSSVDQARETGLVDMDETFSKTVNSPKKSPTTIKISQRSPTDLPESTAANKIVRPKSSNKPVAIILPPVNVTSTQNANQTTGYIALKSPRQLNSVDSESLFSDVDHAERRKSFVEDKMSDSPTQKDPGAP